MDKFEQIELKEYLSMIKKRFWIMVIITLVTTLASAIVSFFFLHKVYESDTTIYVGKEIDVQAAIAYQELLVGQNLVKDYRELVKTRAVTQKVKEELQNDIPWIKTATDDAIASKISVNNKNDTKFIEIRVQDRQPEAAAKIANKVAEVFKDKVVELMKVENISIIDRAQVPLNPIKPRPMRNIAMAFLLGIMAGFMVVFLIEYLDNTVKTPEDVQKYFELNVIGAIPKMEEHKTKHGGK